MKIRSRMSLVLFLFLLSGTGALQAQFEEKAPERFSFSFDFNFNFAPETVLNNRAALDLSEPQNELINREVRRARARFFDFQTRFTIDTERLDSLLTGSTVDEDAVLDALDRLLEVEHELKGTQLRLAIRIRNALTASQLRVLEALQGDQND
jgi:hypothetical protein